MIYIYIKINLKWFVFFLLYTCDLFAQTTDQRAEYIQNGTFNSFISADGSYFKGNSSSDNNPYGYGYWVTAHTLETLADAYQRTRNSVYKDRMKNIIGGIRKYNLYGNETYHNDYYDDLEWLCLASFNCYNATKDSEFLDAVHQIWSEIKTGYANNAMSWKKGCTSPCNNSIANAPAIIIAVKLYQLEGDPVNLQMAKDIHAWMKANVLNAQGGIWDAPDNYDPSWQFSYNSGMYIGACLELSIVTGQQSYVDDGIKASEFMMNYRLYDGGVFYLNEKGQGDGGLFKGIFAKWFAEFVRVGNLTQAQKERYLKVIKHTGDYVWDNSVDKSSFLISPDWERRPNGTIDLSTQTSGVHLFESIASLNKVHLYQDINYGGFYSQLPAGNYTSAQLLSRGTLDNYITSLTIPDGYTITVFENDNFSGTSKVFTSNTPWLNDWNDRISSIKIDFDNGFVNVFQEADFGGYKVGFVVGDYSLSDLVARGMVDNDITSVKVNPGYKVILYSDDNFTGTSTTITSDTNSIVNLKDQVTSLKVKLNLDNDLGNKTYYLQNRNSSMNMSVSGSSLSNGANIAQNTPSEGDNQKFTFTNLTDEGLYKIIVKHSGQSLDINNYNKANGANLEQYPYNATTNQQFFLISTGDGYYKIIAKHSGRLLEVLGASIVNGANVQQFDDNKQTSGQWKLIPVTQLSLETQNKMGSSINLYPNPVKDTLFLTSDMKGIEISIFSLIGNLVLKQKCLDNSIDVSALKSGVYFIFFDIDDNKIVKQFVKK
ncbi:RICIN domain-containing protein [Flavobacterium franklandianum]|uniref:T9SS type A sorting domain-containing protein n=1 Tax=Flavobacterium franklandianum TaxID=2594430 RepID=A0A553CMM7_9FLAO|nr:RICIN domain-containing protein [Flavobacterium franklandianum]TRX21665.1 T9SS type A sorting domain-containing protein [Flavobacterium franklandianum]